MSAAVVNITLNRLIEEFFKVGAAHKMIETTFYGDFLNIVSSNRVKYCSLLVNTADGNISKSYIEFRVEIAVMDKVFNDQSNLNDVESDTAQILQDLYSVIDYSNRWQSFAKISNPSAPIRKFISKGQDVVTGWSMTLNIGVKRRNGICNIPIENYDYQGNYAAYCAGVRIFQDNILIEVVPSGGRFDFSGSANPINITVNGGIFYSGVTTDQNIEVKDSTGTNDVGSKVGSQWRIGDSHVNITNTNGDPLINVSVYAEQTTGVQVGDAEQTFNGDPITAQPAETTKNIIVETLDENPIGTVIEDTKVSFKIQISNSQVNVNGDAFESIAPGSTFNVPILDTAGNATGTNIGPSVEVADSDILISTQAVPQLLQPIRSQQSKTIAIIDAIDADPVQVNVVTDTESSAEIVVPNGTVLVKNTAGVTIHTATVKPGGSVNQPVADVTQTLNGAAITNNKAETSKAITIRRANNDPVVVTTITDTETVFIGEVPDLITSTPISNSDDSYVSTVTTGVAKELPDITLTINGAAQANQPSVKNISINATNIIYLRPQSSGVVTSYLTGDEWDNTVNYPPPAAPAFGIPAYLDPTNPKLLLNNNAFGNKQRFTGINGGYYDYAAANYKLANGTVSDQATTFGTTAANTSYIIDNHTGLAMKWNIQGSATFSSLVTTILGLTHAGFSDYFLGSVQQQRSWFCFFNLGTNITSIIPFNSANSCKTSTPTFANETTQHHQITSVNIVASRADGTNDAAYAMRWHF